MAQQGVERRGFANQDLMRTGRMAAYGGAIFGPAATKWFGFLVKRVNIANSPNGTILARVACDQFLFAPVNMAVFLSSMAYMEGASVKQRLKDAYLPGYQKNLMIWPWIQFTNFKYVPAEMRVLVVNIVSLGKSTPRRRTWRRLNSRGMWLILEQAGTATSATSTRAAARSLTCRWARARRVESCLLHKRSSHGGEEGTYGICRGRSRIAVMGELCGIFRYHGTIPLVACGRNHVF
jgi:protein Mpv17